MFKEITPNNVLKYLDHVMNFQLNDLRKASILATANFLVAVGCMNTIEFLGGIKNELLGTERRDLPKHQQNINLVESRFKEGVKLLQGEYINPPRCNEEIMYELRNSLTHQYLATVEEKAKIKNVFIKNNWGDNRAIIRGKTRFTLNVAKLIFDLGISWGDLRQQIKADKTKRENVAKLLNTLPILQ